MTGSAQTLGLTRNRRVISWSAATSLLLLLIVAGVALALPSQRPPRDDIVVLGGTNFTLSAAVVGAPLRMGTSSTLQVSIKNPSTSAMRVTSINARAVSIFNQKCKGAWIQVRRYSASATLGALVPARSTRTLRLGIRLTNLPTVNQDACKNVALPLVLSGQAVVIP